MLLIIISVGYNNLNIRNKAIIFTTITLCIGVCLVSSGFGVIAHEDIKLVIAHEDIKLNDNKLYNDTMEIRDYIISSSYPKISDYGDYIKVDIKDTNSLLTNPGNPILPFYSIVAKFPSGTEIIDVTCTYSEPKNIHLDKKIMPAPQLERVINNNFSQKNLMQGDEESYPGNWYQYRTGGGIDNGMHVTFLLIHFYPVRYLSNEDILMFVEQVELKVIYKTPMFPLADNEKYPLVIITPSIYERLLQPLVDHKNSIGLPTKLVTLDEIYAGEHFSVQGRDNAEKIKYFIKDAAEQWGSDYILLIGDIYKLPIRKVWIGALDLLSDLYYADLYFSNGSFCSWDSNNNGYFGEYWHYGESDLVDLYPDVYVGRLACANRFEVRTVVNKIIQYETKTYGEDWFNTIVLAGGDTHPKYDGYEGEVTCEEISENMPSFTPVKLYTSDNSFTPRSFNRAINDGAGFVAYSGHGFASFIGTHPPNDEEWIYYRSIHLLGLWNRYKLPVIFFAACLTGQLDYTLGDLLGILEVQQGVNLSLPCFAWRFVRKPFGGAIATIGATRGPWSSDYLEVRFFKAYNSSIKLANMFVQSQIDYLNNVTLDWQNLFTLEQFVLLGDPSLKVGGYDEK